MTNIVPRFQAIGGDLYADRRPISLAEAQKLLLEWWTLSKDFQRKGDFRRAAEARRQADALQAAKIKAEQWIRCGDEPSRDHLKERA